NRTVTMAAGSPADRRRLRATEGGGGCISTCTARGSPTGAGAPGSGSGWVGGAVIGSMGRPGGGAGGVVDGAALSVSRYVVLNAAGSPFAVHCTRTTPTGSAGGIRSAHPMSSGTWRQDAWRLRQTISPPIGSACELSPGTPSIGMKYSAGLTRYSCP